MCGGTFLLGDDLMNQESIDIKFMELAYKEAVKAKEKMKSQLSSLG